MGLSRLDLAVELMDLILTRGCTVGLTAEDVYLLCPLDWSLDEDGSAVPVMVSTITGAHAQQGFSSGLCMYGAYVLNLLRKDTDMQPDTWIKLFLHVFLKLLW